MVVLLTSPEGRDMYFQVSPDAEKNSHPCARDVCVKFQALGGIMKRLFWSLRERTSYGISIPI